MGAVSSCGRGSPAPVHPRQNADEATVHKRSSLANDGVQQDGLPPHQRHPQQHRPAALALPPDAQPALGAVSTQDAVTPLSSGPSITYTRLLPFPSNLDSHASQRSAGASASVGNTSLGGTSVGAMSMCRIGSVRLSNHTDVSPRGGSTAIPAPKQGHVASMSRFHSHITTAPVPEEGGEGVVAAAGEEQGVKHAHAESGGRPLSTGEGDPSSSMAAGDVPAAMSEQQVTGSAGQGSKGCSAIGTGATVLASGRALDQRLSLAVGTGSDNVGSSGVVGSELNGGWQPGRGCSVATQTGDEAGRDSPTLGGGPRQELLGQAEGRSGGAGVASSDSIASLANMVVPGADAGVGVGLSLRATYASEMPTSWAKGEAIGSGSQGRVYLVLNNETGELLASKEVSVAEGATSKKAVEQLEHEVALLASLHHPNIVRYVGTSRQDNALYIFMEYIPGGSLAALLSWFGPLDERVIRIYTRQVLQGLAYLHAQRIVHRDIKCANLLLEKDGTVKLADFGMARQLEALSVTCSFKGSAFWMAPEVIKQQGHGVAADIWSIGCTVLEMATGKPPWNQCTTQVQAIFRIASSDDLPVIPPTLSTPGAEFVRLCLQRDPARRPTVSELLQHPFVAPLPGKAVPALAGRQCQPTMQAHTLGVGCLGAQGRADSNLAPKTPGREMVIMSIEEKDEQTLSEWVQQGQGQGQGQEQQGPGWGKRPTAALGTAGRAISLGAPAQGGASREEEREDLAATMPGAGAAPKVRRRMGAPQQGVQVGGTQGCGAGQKEQGQGQMLSGDKVMDAWAHPSQPPAADRLPRLTPLQPRDLPPVKTSQVDRLVPPPLSPAPAFAKGGRCSVVAALPSPFIGNRTL